MPLFNQFKSFKFYTFSLQKKYFCTNVDRCNLRSRAILRNIMNSQASNNLKIVQ